MLYCTVEIAVLLRIHSFELYFLKILYDRHWTFHEDPVYLHHKLSYTRPPDYRQRKEDSQAKENGHIN